MNRVEGNTWMIPTKGNKLVSLLIFRILKSSYALRYISKNWVLGWFFEFIERLHLKQFRKNSKSLRHHVCLQDVCTQCLVSMGFRLWRRYWDAWKNDERVERTLQATNISHLGQRNIIFKSTFQRGYVSSRQCIYLEKLSFFLSPKFNVEPENFYCGIGDSLWKRSFWGFMLNLGKCTEGSVGWSSAWIFEGWLGWLEGNLTMQFLRSIVFLLYGPFPVTTRIITFLVGNSYKPLFATVTGKGPHPMYSKMDALRISATHFIRPFLLE